MRNAYRDIVNEKNWFDVGLLISPPGNCFYDPLLLLAGNGEDDTDSTPLLAEEAGRHSRSSRVRYGCHLLTSSGAMPLQIF